MFKVGDKVRIIHNNKGRYYGWMWGMDQYVDTEATIKVIHAHGVLVEGNPWSWSFESIELLREGDGMKKVKPKVKAIRKKALSTLLYEKMGGKHGVSNYALRFSKLPDRIQAKDICNARMIWWSKSDENPVIDGECTEIVQDVRMVAKGFFGQQMRWYREYINWVMNDSPWSGAIITKSLSVALRYGVKFNVDAPLPHIMAAAIVLREGSEYGHRILPSFHDVLSKGYSGNVAYLAGSTLQRKYRAYLVSGFFGGHRALSPNMRWESIKRFFKEGYRENDKLKPMRTSKDTTYRVFDFIANTAVGDGEMQNVLNKAAGVVPNTGWGVPPKPIHKASLIQLADFIKEELEG